jgi:hypothetical protein
MRPPVWNPLSREVGKGLNELRVLQQHETASTLATSVAQLH